MKKTLFVCMLSLGLPGVALAYGSDMGDSTRLPERVIKSDLTRAEVMRQVPKTAALAHVDGSVILVEQPKSNTSRAAVLQKMTQFVRLDHGDSTPLVPWVPRQGG